MREPRTREDAPEALEQLVVSALRSWDRQAREIQLIKMRENAVFRIVDTRGEVLALRVHSEGNHDDDALRSEMQWMTALQAAGIDVPTVIPAKDGRLFVHATADGLRNSRQVDLLRWIDGVQLGTSEGGLGGNLVDAEHIYRTAGNIMARLHNQATQWTLPEDFQRPSWDLEGLVGERPLWGRFWELSALSPDQRTLLLRARERVRDELQALGHNGISRQHYSLIHADFVPENLLVSWNGAVHLLDFDDAGFGWHLFDIATALYFIQDDPQYEAARSGLIDGYRSQRALPDKLLEALPVFMTARSFTYLGWVHTRPHSKDGQAILPHLIRLACAQARRFLRA